VFKEDLKATGQNHRRTHPKYFFRPRAFSLVENDFNQMGPEVQYRLHFL
jgi:hypothetical protein